MGRALGDSAKSAILPREKCGCALARILCHRLFKYIENDLSLQLDNHLHIWVYLCHVFPNYWWTLSLIYSLSQGIIIGIYLCFSVVFDQSIKPLPLICE